MESPMNKVTEFPTVFVNFILMPGTDGTPDYDSGSHCQTDDHDGQHVHDLTAVCNGGRTFGSVKLSDNEQR